MVNGIQIVSEKTRCRHYMDYSFRLAVMVLLYTPSHRLDITYHGLYYTSRRTLAGTRIFLKRYSNNMILSDLMYINLSTFLIPKVLVPLEDFAVYINYWM